MTPFLPACLSTGVHQRYFLAPTLFNTCMDHVLGRMSEKSGEMSFGTVRITDLDFAIDAGILAETTEVLAEALESMSEEAVSLGLRVFGIQGSRIRSRRSVTSLM